MRSTAEVSVATVIEAEPKAVYERVADVASMGRWSPECVRTAAGVGPAPVGAEFKGTNKGPSGRSWSTRCRVMVARSGERFTFRVRFWGMPVATWDYRFRPVGDGTATEVTETAVDQRNRLLWFLGSAVSGVWDRSAHNAETMRQTLERLRETLEAERRAG